MAGPSGRLAVGGGEAGRRGSTSVEASGPSAGSIACGQDGAPASDTAGRWSAHWTRDVCDCLCRLTGRARCERSNGQFMQSVCKGRGDVGPPAQLSTQILPTRPTHALHPASSPSHAPTLPAARSRALNAPPLCSTNGARCREPCAFLRHVARPVALGGLGSRLGGKAHAATRPRPRNRTRWNAMKQSSSR